ncbi:hypothetical protein FRC07_001768 [Ceratobasidium sp. 392]|nr:hypothetical protein FRC07_001768 [Ceratobasidium sp. 392]
MAEKNVAFRSSEPLLAESASLGRPNREWQPSDSLKKKQVLLALLSELTDPKDEDHFKGGAEDPTIFAARFLYTAQDVSSREGMAAFRAFENHSRNLDRQFQSFANSVRQLGASAGLLNAAYHLRGTLIRIEHFFRGNAEDLFPEMRRGNIGSARLNGTKPYHDSEDETDSILEKRRVLDKDRIHGGMKPQVKPLTDFEQFPFELETLSTQIEVFVDRLNDIPEFTDELVNSTFLSFACDLRVRILFWLGIAFIKYALIQYRASCLSEFKGQLKTIAVKRYINTLSVDIGAHVESMNEALNSFVEIGVPTIRHAQNHTANGLQYLSAVVGASIADN